MGSHLFPGIFQGAGMFNPEKRRRNMMVVYKYTKSQQVEVTWGWFSVNLESKILRAEIFRVFSSMKDFLKRRHPQQWNIYSVT